MSSTDTNNNKDFYLDQLNIDLSAVLLTIPDGDDTDAFTANCDASLNCPVAFAQHFLQFHTDGIDVDDLNTNDLRFRTFHIPHADGAALGNIDPITYYNSRNVLVAEAVTTANAIEFYGSNGVIIDRLKVHRDSARHISKEIFGTSAGVDIFTNERAYCLDLLQKSVSAFVARLDTLSSKEAKWNNEGTDPDLNNHPSKMAFKQMIQNFPERFATLTPHAYDATGTTMDVDASGTSTVWYYMPFLAGDKLYFKLTVNADEGQGAIIDTADTIPSRTYKICLHLVDNIPSFSDDSYSPTWTASGPNLAIEPAYLQPDSANDTV